MFIICSCITTYKAITVAKNLQHWIIESFIGERWSLLHILVKSPFQSVLGDYVFSQYSDEGRTLRPTTGMTAVSWSSPSSMSSGDQVNDATNVVYTISEIFKNANTSGGASPPYDAPGMWEGHGRFQAVFIGVFSMYICETLNLLKLKHNQT